MDLIKKTAEDLNIDINIVGKVISSSFEEFARATRTYNSLEVSGFGTFKMSPNKILKKLPSYKYISEYYEKRYLENPNPEDFKKMNETKQSFENLKYRYEQLKGEPPVILERGKTLR